MKLPSTIISAKLVGTLIWILGAYTVYGQNPGNKLLDKIIATIDDQILLESDLEKEYQYYQAHGRPEVANLKCKILEGLLINKMLLARAETEKINVLKEEVERMLAYKMQVFLSQAGSQERLEQYTGKPIAVFKEELRNAVKEQLTVEKMRNKIVDGITITLAEVKKYFQELPDNELPYYATAVEVRQIVRYPTISQQDKLILIERLRALRDRIQAGEDFGQLARQYSEDPGSASEGGELGFWRIGELVPAYEAAALALKPGEISQPVETPFGFHLIQLIERQKDRYQTRHILLKTTVSSSAMQEAQAYLDSIRTQILEKKITFEKAAITYSEDKATSSQGGLITDESQETKVSIESLPSDVFFIVEKLQPGEISRVAEWTSPTGKRAVRMVYLKSKIPAHQANFQQDYDKIYQLALEDKKAQALTQWFKRVKEDTTIKVDPAYQACPIFQ